MPDGPGLHLLSSLTAGLVYSLASLPLDTAKTRMQTQVGACVGLWNGLNRRIRQQVLIGSIAIQQAAPKPGEQLLYRSTPQTLMKIASEEGVSRLWKVRKTADNNQWEACMVVVIHTHGRLPRSLH